MNREPAIAVDARVARIYKVGSAGTLIDLAMPRSFPAPRAGQFVEVACQPPGIFRLRRPFSICRWQPTEWGGEIGILFSVVGEGSLWLESRRPGDPVELLGPLGTPFRALPGRVPVLVGGGRGVAPMLLLAEQIAEEFPDGVLLYGAQSEAALFPTEGCPYPVYRSTLDGSVGQRGTVLDLAGDLMRQGILRGESLAFYGCGPTAMLRALAAFAASSGNPAQLSLETTFGCGTGLCAGCAVPLAAREGEEADAFRRYAFACTEGPVFDAARVDWEGVGE